MGLSLRKSGAARQSALILNLSTELNEINLLVQGASSDDTQPLRIILPCDVVEWMLNAAALKIQT